MDPVDVYKDVRAQISRAVVYPLLEDPLAGGWTALQAWNPRSGRGALLAFRQDAPEAMRKIAGARLRRLGVDPQGASRYWRLRHP